jgi:hypothetical protein
MSFMFLRMIVILIASKKLLEETLIITVLNDLKFWHNYDSFEKREEAPYALTYKFYLGHLKVTQDMSFWNHPF